MSRVSRDRRSPPGRATASSRSCPWRSRSRPARRTATRPARPWRRRASRRASADRRSTATSCVPRVCAECGV
ncbi:unnamed protein product [Trichogramma brassicae]|uniref:Uncharacterized protein n=1 Tax=Trichogramma brassicae TaxID=86971 RepID=A0A6H5IHQ5_9HYME|nr:unnamed protein product [Trichogramma brassicae]